MSREGHISTSYTVHCEGCCKVLDLLSGSVKSARNEANEMGWKVRKKNWYCPQCQRDNNSDEK